MIKNHSNKISLRDKKVIKIFTELGISKNTAKTLICISKNGGCRSVDIEQNTNQRQPAVSEATQELLKKGWVVKQDIRKKGNVKPILIYKLAYPIDEITTKIEKEKFKEIDNIRKNLLAIKTLVLTGN
jgi:predicted transcriptional regulator